MKKSELGVGLFLMAAIVFLIIPIPSLLLDVMLSVNLSVSMVIMFTALF